ncbi:hypothetical protein [uncultured Umboniibacter sp.]|uniref:hypothetical protein n=1 Tax=uncultured Umboniibacter sp. TaxID=1798917 RepID=UPI00260E7EF2|nr:hypothetical protein [uncultured Umboniibacter sp.]
MKTWIATTAAVLMTSNIALADNCQPGYESVEDAILSTLNETNPKSISSDAMVLGQVYELNDRYFAVYDQLPTGRNIGKVSVGHPQGAETAALFRTSGDLYSNLDNQRVNHSDRSAALQHDVAYYVANASGQLFVAEVGDRRYEEVTTEQGEMRVATNVDDVAIVAAMIEDDC